MTGNSTWIQLDNQYVWHPFTSMRHWPDESPLVIERGEGNYLVDSAGNRYLDGVSSLWVTVHGHNHPVINKAITDQLGRIAHTTLLGMTHPTAAALAERLVKLAPEGLAKVFYSDNGSTAVEIALKLAYQHWQLEGRPEKKRFLHLENSYHGDTLGAVAVGGIPVFHQVFGPLLLETLATPAPHPYRHPDGPDPQKVLASCLAHVEASISAHKDELAAFIVEPLVQGAAGMLVHPEGYLSGIAEICKRHEVLLIVDEVATGFGRTGTMFACQQEGVSPDFLCVAKGLSGGYLPIAATLMTQRVYDSFLAPNPTERRAFYHGHTFTGHPLGCAASLASLDLFDRNKTLESVNERAKTLAAALAEHISPHKNVGDVRQRGLMVGIELVADKSTAKSFDPAALMGARVCRRARERGVILRPLGDVVVLMPPLSVTDEEIDTLVASVAHGLDTMHS